MAYYTATASAWNAASAATGATIPSGASGATLTGMTTAQKIAAVNSWTLPAPKPAILPVDAIINAIAPADFLLLTTTQLQIISLLLAGNVTVDASPGTTVRGVFQSIFAGHTTTLANLTALVAPFDNATTPWVTSPSGGGLTSLLNPNDALAAGLT